MTPPWKKFEQWVADDLGLQLTRGSGNQWHDKGDVAGRGLLVEVKFSDSKMPCGKRSMRLQRAWLDKVSIEAGGRVPLVVFGMGDRYSAYVLIAPIHLTAFVEVVPPLIPFRKSYEFKESAFQRPSMLTPVGIVADYAWFKSLLGEDL